MTCARCDNESAFVLKDGTHRCRDHFYRMGWWDMPCFNALSPEQQVRVVEWGNLPIDYREHLSGPCHNGAQVEVTTVYDKFPGPRFYCLSCAAEYLLAMTSVTL